MNDNVQIQSLIEQAVIEPSKTSNHFFKNGMERYFTSFRKNIIGVQQRIDTPYGKSIPLLYADWTASGRNYREIEERISQEIMPYMANTHTETTTTGNAMTYAYHQARKIIKRHVNAGPNDALVTVGSGATGAINKLQRMMGLKLHSRFQSHFSLRQHSRPVVFVTHMEHHSNHTSWLETIADVVVIQPTAEGQVDLNHLEELLHRYSYRHQKIAAVTACSNVTGIYTPYREIARLMHRAQGYCMVDFSAAAPYLDIDMHPAREDEYLDAVYFSPHKFLGGPGSSGVLVFNQDLYQNDAIPDHPGGGTVKWTNPWGGRKYIEDIEEREDGGTPAILQTIRAALSMQLKNTMSVRNILCREQQQRAILWPRLLQIPNLRILAENHPHRLGIISFYIENLSYNAGVRMLNDRFGIQTRGGCSCAGTYSHYLLGIDRKQSKTITDTIDRGYKVAKPGWIRLSLHPTMTDQEIHFLANGIEALSEYHSHWIKDYREDPRSGTVQHRLDVTDAGVKQRIKDSFTNPFT